MWKKVCFYMFSIEDETKKSAFCVRVRRFFERHSPCALSSKEQRSLMLCYWLKISILETYFQIWQHCPIRPLISESTFGHENNYAFYLNSPVQKFLNDNTEWNSGLFYCGFTYWPITKTFQSLLKNVTMENIYWLFLSNHFISLVQYCKYTCSIYEKCWIYNFKFS